MIKNKLTWAGKAAILFLLTILAISICVEVDTNAKNELKNKNELKQISKENDQRQLLIDELKVVNESVDSSLDGLNNNILAVRVVESKLTSFSGTQELQQQEFANQVNKFKFEVDKNLKRLSSPLSDLYFSFKFSFDNSKELVPSYFKLFKPYYIDENGGLGLVPKKIPQGFDLSRKDYFIPDGFTVEFYKGINNKNLADSVFENKTPALLYNLESLNKDIDLMKIYSDPYKNKIFRKVDVLTSELEFQTGEITSNFDISEYTEKGEYVVFTFISKFPSDVGFSDFKIHTKNSKNIGVKLNKCKLFHKRKLLTRVYNNENTVTDILYKYACELWTSQNINDI